MLVALHPEMTVSVCSSRRLKFMFAVLIGAYASCFGTLAALEDLHDVPDFIDARSQAALAETVQQLRCAVLDDGNGSGCWS